MLGRRRKTEEAPRVERATKPGGKNRPTPTRREREAANRRPLVPNDRKNAAKAAREQARQERLRTREALVTGDERHLPLRDRGPVKRFARDYVDARWNAGEFFLFVALIVVAFSFFATPEAQLITSALLWTTILACFADGWLLARKLRAAVVAKFGEDALAEKPVRYGVLRAFQIRRTRLPRPRVSRGQYPA